MATSWNPWPGPPYIWTPINHTTHLIGMTTSHFQMELCAQEQETNNCFNLLPVVSASQPLRGEYQVCIPFDNPAPPNDIVTVRLQLPAGVRCSRCTLRWTYRTSYPNGAPDWNNCYTAAPAQTFRNCADISIN
ncbi:uncharacterized protein LOC118438985 isoform X2 [Folsomia candida]|uniref:uncharacterized protein LOC110860173 isoform X2 n=1 Tax=Folsomia candida TaxID=158441 RepID=UPI001604C2F9|nr:uncharacterized protein LOC110860173 isoform X2 [Folsomia candida]XP_035715866.1 uncharacterized protein LOC118438985 isoform X2 [Folsomia candida]